MRNEEGRAFWMTWSLIPALGAAAARAARRLLPAGSAGWDAGRRGEIPAAILAALRREIRTRELEAAVEREWRTAERIGCSVLTLADDNYPRLLREIHDPPPVLYCLGDLLPEDDLAVAVVGARKASHYGLQAAAWIAADLAAAGLTIVSGLARGIDSEAHRAALGSGGRTVGILGSGLRHIYPPENRPLCESICRQGAILSPYPLDAAPLPRNFPERNRVLSGMTLGTVVVEAGEFSGSLITARLALEQDREVFAVPGRITAPQSLGTNFLIKSGAKLVQSAADVIEELSPEARARLRPIPGREEAAEAETTLTPEERRILTSLSPEDPVHIDRLAELVPIGTPRLLESLLRLEMRDRVVHLPGQHYILRA